MQCSHCNSSYFIFVFFMYKTELRPPLWHWSLSHRYIVPILHNAFIFVEETAIYMSLFRTRTRPGRYDGKTYEIYERWQVRTIGLVAYFYSTEFIQLKSSYDSVWFTGSLALLTLWWKTIFSHLRVYKCCVNINWSFMTWLTPAFCALNNYYLASIHELICQFCQCNYTCLLYYE